MAKKSKLLSALDREQKVDYKLEHQKKLRKQARSRTAQKARKSGTEEEDSDDDAADGKDGGVQLQGVREAADDVEANSISDGSEEQTALNLAQIDDTDSDSDESQINVEVTQSNGKKERKGDRPVGTAEDKSDHTDDEDLEDEEEDDDDDIPLSDMESLASADKADMIPHQRLTINNHPALLRSLSSFALPLNTLPFSAHQCLTSSASTTIPDIHDDLTRELAFYKQNLDAVLEARTRLKKEKAPFSRPADYFAEMVKSDEHMGKVKSKLVDEAAGKRAAAEARRQRDLKKFGKQVQVAKLQERDKAKRDTLDKIQLLKRKRQSATAENPEEPSLFDVALEENTSSTRTSRGGKSSATGASNNNNKRQKRDQKFGFGGKKRFAKSGDAASSGDISGFSAKAMKGKGKGQMGGVRKGASSGSKRLGKSRRAKVG
ncbi:MAG: rRNA-processing protein and EBNA1-binding protein ebp2 [Caeruleum heppii]|nr:MAG: rRNA-processing protein and EBNA1-binding protein ebp2 [Caeruleum heppii]